MKIAIVSDIHGNFEAISALPEKYNELWVLGDLVNYGPDPAAVIDYVKRKAWLIVRGNHDHSVGFNEDPRCSGRFREMAEATRRYTESVLSFVHKHFLRNLPLSAETRRKGTRFYLCHAIPSDPLFDYCEPDSAQWLEEIEKVDADVILIGHTHQPAIRTFGSRTVVNPGSLGQPKMGSPEARYAVWEDGNFELKSYSYPYETTAAKIQTLPVDGQIRNELSSILRTGEIPPVQNS